MCVSNYNISKKLREGDISNHNVHIKNVITVLLTTGQAQIKL